MENNLDIDVRNADALGLSYGQYKALHYDPQATKGKKKKPVRKCPICGEEVTNPRRKYCTDACSKVSEKETRRIWAYKRYHELKDLKKDGEQDADS